MVRGTCGEATRLAILSRSDTVLLVLEPRHSRVSRLRGLTSEAFGARAAGVAAVYTPKDFDLTRIMGGIVALVAERHGVKATA